MAPPETPTEPCTPEHTATGAGPSPWLTDPLAAVPDDIAAAARAAHRSQFADPTIEAAVWVEATPAYRHRWHTIAAAALTAGRPQTEPGS